MKRIFSLLLIIVIATGTQFTLFGQEITWTDITSQSDLPEGVQLFSGKRSSPALNIWYYKVDLNQPDIAVVPYLANNSSETISSFSERKNVYGAINAGYFGSGSSYSALIQPGDVQAQNVASVTRNGASYPVMRSLFSLSKENKPAIDWIYHFSSLPEGVYEFDQPLGYASSSDNPLPSPKTQDGSSMTDLLMGVGGGPTLVKGDSIHLTYFEEIFWGSGVGRDNRDPRSAVGYTKDNQVILLVADGRQNGSQGVSLPELAQIMIDLGCAEAMNLDGGGSSQMTLGSTLVNAPEGGSFQRPVATFLAITHRDSIPELKQVDVEYILDTEFDETTIEGTWGETANPGFYGNSKSLISLGGDGSNRVVYAPTLPSAGNYTLYGWWVASFNRSKRSAYIVHHAAGIDTVYADQSTNNAKWVELGEFEFLGTSEDKVVISNLGNDSGNYIVADAIRFASSSAQGTSVEKEDLVSKFSLIKAYPNPFNPTTQIEVEIAVSGDVELAIYNSAGIMVQELWKGRQSSGVHRFNWDATEYASGVYVVRLRYRDLNGSTSTYSHMITLIK